ncbi:MAG: hypothetical protein HDR08_01560 [Lachnospiraceae bacterium]|nr:hypothetical protein [Lachnospiraceae bacterium]
MSDEKEKRIRKVVQILSQLDETSLLLVVHGANLLAARQKIVEKKELQET